MFAEYEKNHNSYKNNYNKKISNWKTPDYVGMHWFWFKKSASIHDRQELVMNKCPQGANLP